ncbi:MAG: ATP-binding protein [Armatimonadetes bacterium]|nr:ATP-binding protein [Armatimonadota bacterium]
MRWPWGHSWSCGFEFDFANPESFYCRPLRLSEGDSADRLPVPPGLDVRVAYLPPMSGLADREFVKQRGETEFLIGQGRTAEVLRNLCLQATQAPSEPWPGIRARIQQLFGVVLDPPRLIPERSEVELTCRTRSGIRLDLSCAGRGLQQTLLLLCHLSLNPGAVLLLDEPDAHLETLRQRQVYQTLSDAAAEHDSQIVAASHSEILLEEACRRDVVIAFTGRPHRVDDRSGRQLRKSLKDIPFDHYYQAEQTGWALYLEGPTDLAILRAFARVLHHPATRVLERPFVHYVENNLPQRARDHFYGLRDALPELRGFALFDRLDRRLSTGSPLEERMWTRREIENYLCSRDLLLTWAVQLGVQQYGPLFAGAWREEMEAAIQELKAALQVLGKGSPWSPDLKVSDEFLTPLLDRFYRRVGLPELAGKANLHILAQALRPEHLDAEITEVLDALLAAAEPADTDPG